MRGWGRLGLWAYAVGVGGLGVTALIARDVVIGLEALADTVPYHGEIGILTGLLLLGGAIALLVGWNRSPAALAVGWLFGIWVLALHGPHLVLHPRDGGGWTTGFESLALGAAGWVLAGLTRSGSPHMFPPEPLPLGRVLYGLSLPAFGVLHFVYVDYVSFVIPGWLPAHVFWAYATGVAHIAAGLAIVTGVQRRLAAILEGCMFGAWVVILHLPRALGAGTNRNEWTSLLIALAMAGGAWLIAASTEARATPAPG